LFALGLVLISVTPSHVDLNHIIFGNLLGVSSAESAQVAALGAIALAVLVAKNRDFTLYAFDPTHAHALGINPRMLGAILLGLLALTSVVALQAVGVVLVVAMLIIPGATAYLLTDRFQRMLLIAPAISVLCAIIGLYSSYYLDTASGGRGVLAQGAGFILVYLFGPRDGLIGRGVAAGHRESGRMSGIGKPSGTVSSRLGEGEPPRRGSAVPARVGRSPRRAPAASAEGEDRTRGTRTGEVARAADLGSSLSLGPNRGERGERH